MTMNACAERAVYTRNPPLSGANRATANATLEFGRFRLQLRQRQLLADGVPIELGTRAFELLLALLEADGSLVTKEELMSRVWPGIVVAEENLKVQIAALRKALGEDRDFIRTEFGRGYRFIAAVRSQNGHQSTQRIAPQWIRRRSWHRWCVRPDGGNRFEPAHNGGRQTPLRLISSATCKGEQR